MVEGIPAGEQILILDYIFNEILLLEFKMHHVQNT